MFAATFVAGMSYNPYAFTHKIHPYKNKRLEDLPIVSYTTAQKEESELLFFFTYSCPHCINSMENLKAWGTTKAVDKLTAYVVDPADTQIDSLRNIFQYRYPSIHVNELSKDITNFIEAYPSAFLIKNDTVRQVIIGELPSPYLFK